MNEIDNIEIKISADLEEALKSFDNVSKHAETITEKINQDFSNIGFSTEGILDLSSLEDTFSSVSNTLGSSLKQAITKGEFDFNNFANKVSNIFLDLGLDISQSFFENIFSGASGFSLGELLTGGGGSGKGGLFSGLGNIVSGLFSSVFGGSFASGGSIPSNKISLVGEKGPELFIPNTSGQIINNIDSAKSFNSQSDSAYNINFNVNAVDGQSFIGLLQQPQARNLISNFAVSAVQKQSNKALRSSPFE